MTTIYKYNLPIRGSSHVEKLLPIGAVVLSCGFQGEELMIWCIVNPDEKMESQRNFYVLRTGEEVAKEISSMKFIGTAQDPDPVFRFVVHVFEYDPL